MKSHLSLVLLVLIAMFAVFAVGHAATQQSAEVAAVNGESITEAEFYAALERKSGEQVLQQLIIEKMLMQEAKRLGIMPSDSEVEMMVANIKAQVGGDEEAFARALAQYNITEERLREEFVLGAILQQLAVHGVSVTEEEVAEFFDANKEELLQVRASHILVETEQEAKDLKARIDAGEDFAALAKEYSKDGTAANGGDLGYFGKGQMVQPFEDAAFGLTVGETSQVVQTQFGFHLIRLADRKDPDLASLAPEIRQQVLRQKAKSQEQIIDELVVNTDIDVFWPQYSQLNHEPVVEETEDK